MATLGYGVCTLTARPDGMPTRRDVMPTQRDGVCTQNATAHARTRVHTTF